MESAKQKQTSQVFSSLWNDLFILKNTTGDRDARDNDYKKILKWSDGKVISWINAAIKNEKFTMLDSGCGIGWTISQFIEKEETDLMNLKEFNYTGIDLIDISNNQEFLSHYTQRYLQHVSIKTSFRQMDMLNLEDLDEEYDLVWAMGTLHHTPSVEDAFKSTYGKVKRHGTYIGWIINSQKPHRRISDDLFRQYFQKFDDINDCIDELRELSNIFQKIGSILGDEKIEIKKDLPFLELQQGQYLIQELLYDYFFKCFYKSGSNDESQNRIIASLFDWFNPEYYHQTSRSQLEKIIEKVGPSNYEIVTKTNGHFFRVEK